MRFREYKVFAQKHKSLAYIHIALRGFFVLDVANVARGNTKMCKVEFVGISLLAAERKPCRSETRLYDHTCGVRCSGARWEREGDGGVKKKGTGNT
jgi:hypothetical protein